MSGVISEEKVMLRSHYKDMRNKMTLAYKRSLDLEIARTVLMSDLYVNAEHILFYMATKHEIETRNMIRAALACGKKVSLPRCTPEGTMEFYYISSLSDVKEGSFGILEPERNPENLALDFENSLCIVPGLSFDPEGNRLGYGKGYYDKFLRSYKGVSMGLCYGSFVKWSIPAGKFDVPVDFLATDSNIRKTH